MLFLMHYTRDCVAEGLYFRVIAFIGSLILKIYRIHLQVS